MKFETKTIHAGLTPDPSTGAVITPIFQTSTYVQSDLNENKGYEYSRSGNPTRSALEKNLAALENATFGRCFASGMAATETVMKLLKPGDQVLCSEDLYGGTIRLIEQVYQRYGIQSVFVDMTQMDEVAKSLTEQTKLVWIETPTNPLLQILDIAAIADLAHQRGAKLAVDNTFSSPFLQNPLDLGADVVMHSLTKYIAGHSDVIMGFLGTREKSLDERFGFFQNACGNIPGPQDCFLTLRGVTTLHVRMERHCANAAVVANFLDKHPQVASVRWPGLPDHPNHVVAKKQMRDFGAMMSFTLKDESIETVRKVLKKFKLFSLAESLGGVESLVGYPAGMTHAGIPREIRLSRGISDGLIRLSIGIEHIDDILQDIEEALTVVY